MPRDVPRSPEEQRSAGGPCTIRTLVRLWGRHAIGFCGTDDILRPGSAVGRWRRVLAAGSEVCAHGCLLVRALCPRRGSGPPLFALLMKPAAQPPPRAPSAPAAGSPSSHWAPLRPQRARGTHRGGPQAGKAPGPRTSALLAYPAARQKLRAPPVFPPQPFTCQEPSGRHQ